MSEKNKMTRKRRRSTMNECNNNDSEAIPKGKRRRTMGQRIMAQLQSDFTDKMIIPLASPEGQPTSRFGRKINTVESPNNRIKKMLTQQSKTQSKRKTQLNENKVSTNQPIIDLCTEVSTYDTNCIGQMDEKMETHEESAGTETAQMAIDYEDDLKTFHLVGPMKFRARAESIQIVDEVDLTSSTDGSVSGDDDKSNNNESEQFTQTLIPFPLSEADSTSSPPPPLPPPNASHKKTDLPKLIEIINISHPISDCAISTSGSDAISVNDKPFSECTSDDCVIADGGDSDSTENWHVGQIVWAALASFPFWPAVVFNSEEEHTFQKDNQIHVKFLYDNGRRNWVNANTAILPFKGRNEFAKQCQLPANRRNKSYKYNSSKKWNVAVQEANVLQCITLSNRIEFYDKILMVSVHKMDTEIRSNRHKVEDRCDTPQTFDTAYSSMKQSVSPASLSPTLNELDRNYDVGKNINNYLKSVELSRPEELPEEDLQMDDSTMFAAISESPSSSDQIYCRLTKLVYDKLRDDDRLSRDSQNTIANENKFVVHLNELWSEMVKTKQNPNTSLKRLSRKFSIDSVASNSTAGTPNQTKRQRQLAVKKAMAEKQMEALFDEINKSQIKEKPSKEKTKLEKQRKLNENLMNFCITRHPANFLLKGLPKDPVCQFCLGSGSVMKCAGKCSLYFHRDCLSKSLSDADYNAILKRKMLENDEETTDTVSIIEENLEKMQCAACTTSTANVCFVCSDSDADCVQCCDKNCGKAYHLECLKYWPQHKKQYASNQLKSLHCSRHVCHTCVSPDIRNMFHTTESDKKLIKCILCPGTYHRSSECIPAGSELLSETQLICARHQSTKNLKRLNIDFCLFCSQGGSLICCDACVYAFHQDCLKVPVGDHFNCEECESGRRPLFGEIVWCKYSCSPWWPAITVPTPCIPDRVCAGKKEPNQICVFFFGTHDYGWVSQNQIYRYVHEDKEFRPKNEKGKLKNAMDEAEQWMNRYQEITEKNVKSSNTASKPPPYKKIKTNRVVARFKESEYNECKCRPDDPAPCSIESNCYNAMLNFECDPDLCPAKDKCQNQNFHRGEQFSFQVKMTKSKGWGLFAKEKIPAEKFIIEYMGEVIDSVEFDQRFSRAKANKDDNYYFLTLGQNMYIDAAVYGNEARFINHSCDPNVAPNKWTVYSNGQEQIRIGFFARREILPGEEITFDYNWGKKNMQTVCQCGSKKCRGHI
ncbi:nuclear receptor binding SET domain protein isoform X2 [Sitodiplosis mosellana]|uniref:nuclear receptor binding SET domain protein isoform X2 n=1 Tax=Sitodiplosis mosellana TaxID=263140 RepID=UPI0024445742|nr:nuclear receptor binding SET domain protein isoform X2 [Sitodiplosis mosellana]